MVESDGACCRDVEDWAVDLVVCFDEGRKPVSYRGRVVSAVVVEFRL